MSKNILNEVSKDEEARAYYESQLIYELDQQGKINHAKKEGKLEVALNLLKIGMPILQISEVTGFDVKTIETLSHNKS